MGTAKTTKPINLAQMSTLLGEGFALSVAANDLTSATEEKLVTITDTHPDGTFTDAQVATFLSKYRYDPVTPTQREQEEDAIAAKIREGQALSAAERQRLNELLFLRLTEGAR